MVKLNILTISPKSAGTTIIISEVCSKQVEVTRLNMEVRDLLIADKRARAANL